MTVTAEKVRIEREYDVLIEQLNAAQRALGNKATKATELELDEYRCWFEDSKQEVTRLQHAIAAKKAERAEMRRRANNWQPPRTKKWLDRPSCVGFWWYFGPLDGDEIGFDVVEIFSDTEGGLIMEDNGEEVSPEDNLAAKWLFIPYPSSPSKGPA